MSIVSKIKMKKNFQKNGVKLLGVQISSICFPKDCSSCCEWFIVIADFGSFREVKHANNIQFISVYIQFEFHTKTLIFTGVKCRILCLPNSICGIDFLL